MNLTSVNILGVSIGRLTLKGILQKVEQIMCSGSGDKLRIATINPEFLVEAVRNKEFAHNLEKADLAAVDGSGIIWASYYLNLPWRGRIYAWWQLFYSLASLLIYPRLCYRYLPERITGVDLTDQLARLAAECGWKLFLLGAKEGVAKEVQAILHVRYPQLQVVGTYAGSPAAVEAEAICQLVKASQADILLVAYGAPRQDFWLATYLPQLPSVKVGMGVGGTFDFLAGQVRRAPVILRRFHLEWLWRLVCQPWRLLRIGRATFQFIWLVQKQRGQQHLTSSYGGAKCHST